MDSSSPDKRLDVSIRLTKKSTPRQPHFPHALPGHRHGNVPGCWGSREKRISGGLADGSGRERCPRTKGAHGVLLS